MNPQTADLTLLKTASGTACGSPRLAPAELGRLLENPDDLLWRYADRPVKIDHQSLIVEAEIRLDGDVVPVAYKRFRPRRGWKALVGLLGRSRAIREFHLARALLAHGVATPEPIFACRPAGRRRATSYLATEWIAGAENLHLYLWRLAGRPAAERLRGAARAAAALGRLVGRMHAAGFSNRDLKAANLLVRGREEGDRSMFSDCAVPEIRVIWPKNGPGYPLGAARPKAANLLVVERPDDVAVWLVDLAGVRVAKRHRAADLARLAVGLAAHPWVGASVCRRFLRAYAAEFPTGAVDWKWLWRAVAARSRRLAADKRRRGQEVL